MNIRKTALLAAIIIVLGAPAYYVESKT